MRVQAYARAAGVLFLISVIAGGFGELFVTEKLVVWSDAAATAKNILASESMFRLGFASYLVEAICDIALTLVLYLLLRPVHRPVALLAAFFRLVSTSTFAAAELFYFAALVILKRPDALKAFPLDQQQALALLSLRLYGAGGGVFMVFYGIASVLLGALIVRSGFLPKALGVLLAIGGGCFIVRNFALVLSPAYASDLLLAPTSIAMVLLMVWLLARGVDEARWRESAGHPSRV